MAESEAVEAAMIQAAATLTAAYFRNQMEFDRHTRSIDVSEGIRDEVRLPTPGDMARQFARTLADMRQAMVEHRLGANR